MEGNASSFKCELCCTVFSRKSSLNRHVREQHLQPKLYDCKQCGYRFSKKYNLQVHTRNVHSKICKGLNFPSAFEKLATLNKHSILKPEGCEPTVSSSTTLRIDEDIEAKSLAESVLRELKELQRDIQPSENILSENFGIQQEYSNIERSTLEVINIRDNLYPLGQYTLVKTKRTKRANGAIYLKCEFCNKEFKKTYNYLRHRRIHTKVRPFVCILCKKSFPTTAQLKTHCLMHKLDEKLGVFHKLYKCPECGEGFSAVQQFDKHLRSISSCNVTFKCPHCLKSYKTLKTLLRHKHFEKDDDLEILKKLLPSPIPLFEDFKKFHECNFCGIHVNDITLLNQQVMQHENLFKNECGKFQCSFITKEALKIHTKVPINSRHFKCQYCNKCFKTTQSCRRHMLSHIKQLLKPREILQYQTNSLASYPTIIGNSEKGHINVTTSIIKSNKKHKTKLESNSAGKELKYKCEKCEKSFCYKSWLKKHFKYKHCEEMRFECSNCFKKFRTKQSFEYHLLVHSMDRTKTTCQVCGKQYASSKSLKLHLRIHTQEKPFKCDNCCKLFRTSGHLIQHRKANHKE